MEAQEALIKARSSLIIGDPFWGVLALKLTLRMQNEGCDTAATDGNNLYYNEKFIDKLSASERKGLLAHEVGHCVFGHIPRQGNRDPEIWNMACDYPLNRVLLEAGFILPAGGLIDHDGEFTNMTAEEIYEKLLEHKKQGSLPKGWPPNPGKDPWHGKTIWGKMRDPENNPDVDAPTASQLKSEWKIHTAQATEIARQQGHLPGHLIRFMEDMLEPLVDWRELLWPFASTWAGEEYSWRKPNRAYISEDEYFPSLKEEALGDVVLAIDSSGSTEPDMEQFISEFVDIKNTLQPRRLIIMHCDTEVQKVIEVEKEDELEKEHFEIAGGGGTYFSPVFKEVSKEYSDDIEALVYLTDLECNDFGEAPPYPVLWVSSRRAKKAPPFGEVGYIFKES